MKKNAEAEVIRIKRWWKNPRKAEERIENRSVTGLEIFYDLVYSVFFSRLAYLLSTAILAGDISPFKIFVHFLMFVLGWFCWLNFTLYFDLHGNDDIRCRFFALLQMVFVTGMAIFASLADVTETRSFVFMYCGLVAVMAYLWWHTGISDRDHLGAAPYSMALIVAIIFALISLKTNALISSFFWLLSLLSYISAPFVSVIIGKRRHKRRGKIVLDFQHAHISSSLTKRYNRFTVIIIAEIIASVVSGISGMANKEGNYLRLILFGVFVAFFVWTIYSETVAERETIGTVGAFISYHILHLFLTLAISLTGVALLCLLETTSVIGEPNPIYMMLTISILSLLLICGLFQYILKPLRHRVENAEKLSLLIASGIILVLSLILNKHPSLLRPLLLLDMFIPVIFIFLASVTGKPVEKQVSETVEKGIEIHEQRITKVQKEMEEKEKKIIKIISTENDEQEKN